MKEKTISKNLIFKGKVFTVYDDDVKLPDGSISHREVLDHSGGVCILAQIEDEVLMVRQYRYAVGKEMLELPAGKLEKNENPLPAAVRELQEETGYQAGKMISLGSFIPTCGYCNEVIYMFKAEDLTFVGQNLDPTEFLSVERVKIKDLKTMIANNEIQDAKTIVLCYKAEI